MNKTARSHLSLLIYSFCTAISTLFLHDSEQHLGPIVVAFYTFAFTMLVYGCLSMNGIRTLFTKIKQHRYGIGGINIMTGLSWGFSLLSLYYISAVDYLFTYLTALTLGGVIFRRNIPKLHYVYSLLLIIAIIGFVTRDGAQSLNYYYGVTFAFVGGLFGARYSKYSQSLTSYFTNTEILTLRFTLLVTVTFIAALLEHKIKIEPLNFYLNFAVIAICATVIPLYAFQRGLNHLPLQQALSYMPLAPILCYMYETYQGHENLTIIGVISVMMTSYLMLQLNRKKNN